MQRIRVVAVMEATTVTGPAKNLLRFCSMARTRSQPPEISLVTFARTSDADTPPSNEFAEAARAAGIPVYAIPERSRFDARVLGGLRTLFRELSPAIVQTHGSKAHFLTRFSRPRKAKWLAYHHGYTSEDLKIQMYNRIGLWSMAAADCVVTVCRPFADQLADRGVPPDRIRVLANSIDASAELANAADPDLRARAKIPTGARVVLAIGRLSREKGHRDLIEALRILRERRRDLDFHALIVGDGPERGRLTQQIEDAGLSGIAILAGHQRNPLPYYQIADIFVLPSHSEGSPNVLLEAMAAGRPIVACAVGGIPESVEHERSALLVKPGSPGLLAESVERLLDDPELSARLGQVAFENLKARHSPEAYCTSLLRIYSELLA